MAESHGTSAPRNAGQTLTTLVLAQILIAGLALAVIVVISLQLRPLLEEKAELERQVPDLKAEVTSLEAQVQTYARDIATLEADIATLRDQLQQATQLSRFAHPIDLVDLKMLASDFPRATEALQLILNLRERAVGWHLGGRTPEQGFDSPSFAAFVLRELGVAAATTADGANLQARAYRLYETLEPVAEPDIGDLVFYPAGYALFWFRDQRNQPFVVGMTPMGITALEPDFAERLGYRRSGLDR